MYVSAPCSLLARPRTIRCSAHVSVSADRRETNPRELDWSSRGRAAARGPVDLLVGATRGRNSLNVPAGLRSARITTQITRPEPQIRLAVAATP
jgi:hypothetical protein